MNNVISTRVSIFRNLKEFKFEHKLTADQKQEIINIVQNELKNKMALINVNNANENVIKHLKNNALILGNTQNLFVDKKEDLVINMFNGEHITIVGTSISYDKSIIQKAVALVQQLASKINFSYSDEYGYLMSDVAKLGAGIKIETNIMLSALKSINKIEQVRQNIEKLGYNLIETKYPAIYTLSTKCNLGISEKQICSDFENTLMKLQDLESESARMLDVSNHDDILDKTLRSEAILNAAHILNFDELYNIIVNLRIGLNLGMTQLDLATINNLQNLILNNKNDCTTVEEMKMLAQDAKKVLKGEKDV